MHDWKNSKKMTKSGKPTYKQSQIYLVFIPILHICNNDDNNNLINEFSWSPKKTHVSSLLQPLVSHCKTGYLNLQWSNLAASFLTFPLVKGHSQRYKPGLLQSSGSYLLLCFGSKPSLWLLHFPNPVRRSLGCLWNGSSARLLWDVTEKGRSVATSPLCSCRVPRGLPNGGLALLLFRLLVCVFVWKWEVFTLQFWGWAFLFFASEVRVTLS